MTDITEAKSSLAVVDHLEARSSSSASSHNSKEDAYLLAADVRPAAERALVRKMDMRLLPTIILIFIMNYIDVGVFLSFLWLGDPN